MTPGQQILTTISADAFCVRGLLGADAPVEKSLQVLVQYACKYHHIDSMLPLRGARLLSQALFACEGGHGNGGLLEQGRRLGSAAGLLVRLRISVCDVLERGLAPRGRHGGLHSDSVWLMHRPFA